MREAFTVISLYFLVALFMALVATYLLSDPIDSYYATLLGIDFGSNVNTYTATYIPMYRSATIMAFALGVAAPFGWLIAKVFQRDYEYNPYEYQYGRRFR